MADMITGGLASAIPALFTSEIPLPPGIAGPLQSGPNALAKGLGGVGQSAATNVVSNGAESALGMGGQQQAQPPPNPGVVARPPVAPPHPIANTAFNTPSARRPIQAAGPTGGMGGQMSMSQLLELKRRGLA